MEPAPQADCTGGPGLRHRPRCLPAPTSMRDGVSGPSVPVSVAAVARVLCWWYGCEPPAPSVTLGELEASG